MLHPMSDRWGGDERRAAVPYPRPGPPASLPVTIPGWQPAPVSYQEPAVLASGWLRLASYLLEGLLAFATLGIGWLVWALVVGGEGRTPAKQLLGLRVVDAGTGRPAGFLTMLLLRGIVGGIVAGFVFPLTLGILALMPFWDARRQTIFEKVSGTVVITGR